MSNLFKEIVLSLYPSEKILRDSFGEISNHKTINVRTLKPELGGLFDPKVFGPSVDYECFCGKYEGIKNKNQKCDQCNVLITSNKTRRWRMGHVKLNAPVINPLVLKSFAFRLSKIIDISPRAIEDLVYYNCYVVVDKGESQVLKNKQVLDKRIDLSLLNQILQEMLNSSVFENDQKKKKEIEELLENLNTDASEKTNNLESKVIFVEDYLNFFQKNWNVSIKTGSEALYEILKAVDLQKELADLKAAKSFQLEKNVSNTEVINDRIRIIQSLLSNNLKLEWMILHNLPIIPAGIRPATKLSDDNSIATTQINNLYRKVILINRRLAEYDELNRKMKIFFLEIIHNERRRLQRAVDQLLQGSLSNKNDNNTVKSLSQVLSGKEGIPRKHSLGKRVDYSARSVIVPNPSLQLDQVGLPVEMALVIYKPFLIRELLERKLAFTVKEAENMITEHNSLVFSLLNKISKNHPVILNRAPTLHRLGIQGFFPVLTLGKSIQLHPLVTTAFNADFDGDQMAVHLPLTEEAKQETRERLIASNNIINPQNNNLISTPTQDVILGIYYFTSEIKMEDPKFYYDVESLIRDYNLQKVDVRELIIVPASILGRHFSGTKNKLVFTTLGKITFNRILPASFPYYVNSLQHYNENLLPSESEVFEIGNTAETLENKIAALETNEGWKKKQITIFLNNLLKIVESSEMSSFLDDLKNLGFFFVTKSGLSISLFDLPELENKEKFFSEAQERIKNIEDYRNKGFYSDQETYEKKVEVWAACKDRLETELTAKLGNSKSSSLYSIWNSGARANSENLMQIFAMRGNMTNYKGEVIETPILSSLKEGLNPFEFFISVYGAIKGMIDIALKTAEAGYLSRRLIETVQNVIVSTEDCLSTHAVRIGPLQEYDVITNETVVLIPLAKRVYGRYLAGDVLDNGNLLIARGTLILEKQLELLEEHKVSEVAIRSSLECSLFPTVCQKCYGIDLGKQALPVPLGTAVGIIAAQSLGEPGTQLTMRTFHSGGVTSQQEDIVQGLPKVKELLDNIVPPKETRAVLARITGEVVDVEVNEATGETSITQSNREAEEVYFIPAGKKARVKKGQLVKAAESITTGKVDLNQYLEIAGRYGCHEYIKKEIWKVYYSQGIEINEKHIEMFARQMLGNVEVTSESEESRYLTGDIITNVNFQSENKRISLKGGALIESRPILLGIKKVINYFPSFLSAISFQNTSKLLFDYTLFQPKDSLEGVKENMIIGQLVPVGTGFAKRQELENEARKKVGNNK